MAKLTRSLCEKTLITKQDDKDYHSGNAGALTCLFEQDAIKALPLLALNFDHQADLPTATAQGSATKL